MSARRPAPKRKPARVLDRVRRPIRGARGAPAVDTSAYIYERDYLTEADAAQITTYLTSLHPLWEQRYGTFRPAPPGRAQRTLLRPVYWLGNWQFACLGYYEPPRIVTNAAVCAEPFPPVLRRIVTRMERDIRSAFAPADIPRGWHFNTCLINFYGERWDDGAWRDAARVGDHRDFEPGPVGSLSLGARALMQFVPRGRVEGAPVRTQWLEHRAFQAFAGRWWKDQLLHRVQRVEKSTAYWPPNVDGFRTRRVNFTFRYVPPAHIHPLRELHPMARADVTGYVTQLALHSDFWRTQLK